MRHKKSIISGSLGVLLILLGVALLFSFPAIFAYLLGKRLPLLNHTTIFGIWKDIPLPMHFKVYFFNVSNSHDVMTHNADPELKELGPYTYRSWWNKTAIYWNENGTVTFREVQQFFFQPELSIGSDLDFITTLNAPMVVAGALAKDSPIWMRVLVSTTITVLREKLFTTQTVRDLVFRGYPDFLTAVGRILHRDLPNTNGRFAWLYGRNNTDDGVWTSFTGEGNLNLLNIIDRWRGEKELDWWKPGGCNKLNGSNAEISPPIPEEQNELQFFRSDLCRSWTLSYSNPVSYYELNSRRFKGTANLLANSSQEPGNSCFETQGSMPSGVLDISTCQHGAPVLLSYPHFYLGDPHYRSGISGLVPNESRHNFYLDVEPMSGITTGLAARFQVNLHLQKIAGFSQFNNVTDRVFPIFWQELVGQVTPELANELLNNLQRPIQYFKGTCYGLLALGMVIVLVAASLALCYKRPQVINIITPGLPRKQQPGVSVNADADPILNQSQESLSSTVSSITNHKNGIVDCK